MMQLRHNRNITSMDIFITSDNVMEKEVLSERYNCSSLTQIKYTMNPQ